MPSYHENNYRIRSEFTAILKGLSGFQITATESEAYAYVKMIQANRSGRCFSASYPRLPYHSDPHLIHALFNELAKDPVNDQELLEIGSSFKKYMGLAKEIGVEHGYYTVMPLITISFFLLLLLVLLSPHNGFIHIGLAVGFYSIGFLIFSIWSLKKKEQALSQLRNQLTEKINQLRASVTRLPACTACQSAFTSEYLPSYEEAVRDSHMVLASTISTTSFTSLAPTHSSFFYNVSCYSRDISDSLSSTNSLSPQRGYSV